MPTADLTSRYRATEAQIGSQPEGFGAKLAAVIIATIVIAAPWPLGSSGPIAKIGVESLAALAVGLAAWSIGLPGPCYIAGVGIVVFCVAQLVPLPPWIHHVLSPATSEAWKASSEFGLQGWRPISIDPGLTAAAGRRLLLYVMLTAVIAEVVRVAGFRRLVVRAMAVSAIGLAVAGVGIPAQRSKERKLLRFFDISGPVEWWRTPAKQPGGTAAFGTISTITAGEADFRIVSWGVGDGFGPYIVSNHYAGALNLCTPCLAAVIWALPFGARSYGWKIVVVLGVFFAAAYITGVMASSRAGAGATVLTGMAFFTLIAEGSFWRRITAAIFAISVLIIVVLVLGLYLCSAESLGDYWPTAATAFASVFNDPRVPATAFGADLFARAPVLGWGLGTFGELYTNSNPNGIVLYYTHNEYAQLAAEAGLGGIACVVLLCWWLIKRLVYFCGSATDAQRAAGAAGWAGMAGLVFHSSVDWNLHVPANAALACVATGVAVGSSCSPLQRSAESRATDHSWRVPLNKFGVAAMSLVLIVCLARDAGSDHVENNLRGALANAGHPASVMRDGLADGSLSQAIAQGELVSTWDPFNAQLSVLLGDAYLLRAANGRHESPMADVVAADLRFRRAARQAAVLFSAPQGAHKF